MRKSRSAVDACSLRGGQVKIIFLVFGEDCLEYLCQLCVTFTISVSVCLLTSGYC